MENLYNLEKVSNDILLKLESADKEGFNFFRWMRKLTITDFQKLDWLLSKCLIDPECDETKLLHRIFVSVMKMCGYKEDGAELASKSHYWFEMFKKCIAMECLARMHCLDIEIVLNSLPLHGKVCFTAKGIEYVEKHNLNQDIILIYKFEKKLPA